MLCAGVRIARPFTVMLTANDSRNLWLFPYVLYRTKPLTLALFSHLELVRLAARRLEDRICELIDKARADTVWYDRARNVVVNTNTPLINVLYRTSRPTGREKYFGLWILTSGKCH